MIAVAPMEGRKNTAGISVCDVSKRFGETQALDGMSLEVAPGEIVTLLGQNGAGKSTLMRVLATTVLPDTGSAAVAGFDVVSQPAEVRRSVGLVLADERSLYWRLTGRQNLEFFAGLWKLGTRERRTRAAELIELVGLDPADPRMVAKYSTGMRARLNIARGLIGAPRVLLFDEPTRSLDPAASTSVRGLVRSLAAGADLAVLYATHDLHEAAAIGSRALIVASGRIAATAPAGTDAATLEQIFLGAQ